jgi:hypothetical protein
VLIDRTELPGERATYTAERGRLNVWRNGTTELISDRVGGALAAPRSRMPAQPEW